MFCRNCGNNIENGVKFCNKCGTMQPDNVQVNNNVSFNADMQMNNIQPNSSMQMNNIQPNVNEQINNDETLLQEFIGSQYYSITKSKFHIFTFLFGPYYLIYRKMYKFASFWLLGALLISLFLKDMSYVYSVIMCVVVSFKFKSMYPNFARKEINKIKQQNPNASFNDLVNICRKKGGVSVGAIFAGIGIYFAITFIVSYLILIIALA